MSIDTLRGKTREELEEELSKLRRSFAELRIKHRVEGLKNTSILRNKRRELAKVMTVLREKEILEPKIENKKSKTQTKTQKDF